MKFSNYFYEFLTQPPFHHQASQLSNTAKGFINSVPGASGRFASSFSINKILYDASGSFATSVLEFTCSNAKLTYDDI